jgi:DNA primase
LNAQRYNIGNIFKRLEKSGDPWKDIQHHAQSLSRFHPRLKEEVPNNIV